MRNIAINEYIYNKINWEICIGEIQSKFKKFPTQTISECTFISDGTAYYLQKITIICFIYFHKLNGQNSQS